MAAGHDASQGGGRGRGSKRSGRMRGFLLRAVITALGLWLPSAGGGGGNGGGDAGDGDVGGCYGSSYGFGSGGAAPPRGVGREDPQQEGVPAEPLRSGGERVSHHADGKLVVGQGDQGREDHREHA